MQSDQNPFFRKNITPWYDSTFACRLLIFIMLIVFSFALAGIMVAISNPNFTPHLWFPCMLAGLSGFLIIKVWLRLWARARQELLSDGVDHFD
ncbi:MAG: hypothetical protein CSA26_12690 [Desulfobacterales bacterium]|nr:MAG: hypothetical protein CSA26_12690 [Desulfobacterales bacterium]